MMTATPNTITEIRCPHCNRMLQQSYGFGRMDIETFKTEDKIRDKRYHKTKCANSDCKKIFWWVSR